MAFPARPMLLLLLVPMLACQRAPDLSSESSRFARTDRSTWSGEGWKALRWGMGPGDVEVHLRRAMQLEGRFEPDGGDAPGDGRLSAFTLTGSTLARGEAPVDVRFLFLDGRLYGAVEMPRVSEDERLARWTWIVRAELTRQYGEPTAERGRDTVGIARADEDLDYAASWGGSGWRIALAAARRPAEGTPAGGEVAFVDPEGERAARALRAPDNG